MSFVIGGLIDTSAMRLVITIGVRCPCFGHCVENQLILQNRMRNMLLDRVVGNSV